MEMRIRSNTNIAMVFICFIVMFALSACASDNGIENAITSYDEIKEYFEEKIKTSEQDEGQTTPNYTFDSEYRNNDEESNVNIWEYKLQQGNHQNPFAEALLEYFAGGLEPSIAGDISTRALWVDIDGNGTKGVFAMRHEGDWPFPYGRVFYLYNDEVVYKDLGPQDVGFATNFTAERRIVNAMGDGGDFSFTFFRLENGRLIEDFSISGYDVSYSSGWFRGEKIFDEKTDTWIWQHERITEEEFDRIYRKHGLHYNRVGWWSFEDETDLILSTSMPLY